MAQQRLIVAIGRIERALSRLEQIPPSAQPSSSDPALHAKHDRLKAETKAAIADIDLILAGSA